MIEVKDLRKNYGDKIALNGISFSIKRGEVVGLLGLNGAGKSTTMNILTGYISATSGDVTIDGHNIVGDNKAAKRVTGYLPEQPAFYPEMRVDEHLNFICDLKGVTKNKAEREQHLKAICDQIGIGDMRSRMVRNLSKGYRQRVGFAQALVGGPKVLILDEPTVGLDPSQIIEIRELIKKSSKSSTVIISSHILSEIQAICDRVIVIHEGNIIADDTPEGLAARMYAAHKLIVRVEGPSDKIMDALKKVKSIKSVRRLEKMEANAYNYAVEGRNDADIRADVFRALSKIDCPLLFTYGNDFSLEDIFLTLVGDTHARSTGGDRA